MLELNSFNFFKTIINESPLNQTNDSASQIK